MTHPSMDAARRPGALALQRRALLRLSASGALAALGGLGGLAGPAAWAQGSAGARLPRLVTVGGAITELAYLLGAQGQLVGTDTTSLYPLEAQQTPKVGYMRQLSAEGLLSLQPDAVITTHEAGPPAVLEQIKSAGVRLEVVQADHSWAEVQRKLAAVGRAAARERDAQALLQQLDAQWLDVQRLVARASGKKPRVLFILAHGAAPSVAGERTAANAMIRYAGAVNCLAGFDGYRPMTAEAMASAAPDVILTTVQGIEAQGGLDKFWAKPELALTPAFKRRALVQMDALKLLGFGPRLPQAVRELHERAVLA